jgi:hypothetical protein
MKTSLGPPCGLGDCRTDPVVRFGRGPALLLSMRRPVQAVLA